MLWKFSRLQCNEILDDHALNSTHWRSESTRRNTGLRIKIPTNADSRFAVMEFWKLVGLDTGCWNVRSRAQNRAHRWEWWKLAQIGSSRSDLFFFSLFSIVRSFLCVYLVSLPPCGFTRKFLLSSRTQILWKSSRHLTGGLEQLSQLCHHVSNGLGGTRKSSSKYKVSTVMVEGAEGEMQQKLDCMGIGWLKGWISLIAAWKQRAMQREPWMAQRWIVFGWVWRARPQGDLRWCFFLFC